MKKSLLTLVLLFSCINIIFAQGGEGQQSVINTSGNSFPFDITSILIGLVIGGVIGYFVGTKKLAN